MILRCIWIACLCITFSLPSRASSINCSGLLTSKISEDFAETLDVLGKSEAEISVYLGRHKSISLQAHESKIIADLIFKTHYELGLKYINTLFPGEDEKIYFISKTKGYDPYIFAHFPEWNLSEQGRYRLAKIFSAHTNIGAILASFKIEDENLRAQLVQDTLVKFPNTFSEYRNQWKIESSDALVKVLKAIASKNDGDLHKNYKSLIQPLPKADRNAIALFSAKYAASTFYKASAAFEFFEIQDRAVQIEYIEKSFITLISAQGWDSVMSSSEINASKLGNSLGLFLTQIEAENILLNIFEKISRQRIVEREKRDLFLQKWLGGISAELLLGDRLLEIYARRDPIQLIRLLTSHENYDLIPLHTDNNGRLGLMAALRKLSQKFPNALPSSFVEALWDRVKNDTIPRDLLSRYMHKHGGVPRDAKTSSLEILCELTGLKACNAKTAEVLKGNAPVLYELLLEIQEPMVLPVFSDFEFTEDVFKKNRLTIDFFQTLRDLFYLRGGKSEHWSSILNEFELKNRYLDPNEVALFTEKFRNAIVSDVQKSLGESSGKLLFNYEQFMDLQKEWGDIEPIYTLLSRFQGKEKWKDEVPIVLEVFRQSLKGSFKEYKFDSPDGLKQIEMLKTPEQKSEWKKTRTRLTFTSKETLVKANPVSRLTAAREIIENNVLPHILAEKGEKWLEQDNQTDSPEMHAWNSIVLDISVSKMKGNPEELIGELIKTMPLKEEDQSKASTVLFKALVKKLAAKNTSARDVFKTTDLLQSFLSAHEELEFQEQRVQLISDFQGIKNALVQQKKEKQATGNLVFSVLSSAPKLLLTIGDLVECPSCQNYKTGSVVRTLPGYVIDANVQALVSFALSPNQFENFKDYETVVNAVVNDYPIQIDWNGNKKIIQFKIKIEELDLDASISSKPLDKAYLRQMVKLGETVADKSPGLKLEPEYKNDHPALGSMQNNHKAIFNELAESIKASQTGAVKIMGSRNPHGHYSDLVKGIQMKEYTIP